MRLAMLFLLFLLLSCGASMPPTPIPGQKPIDVVHIWEDYEFHKEQANETWKDKWLYVRMYADKVESGGKVKMYMGGSRLIYVMFDFKDDNEVMEIDQFDTVDAMCRLKVFAFNSWLVFHDCTFP